MYELPSQTRVRSIVRFVRDDTDAVLGDIAFSPRTYADDFIQYLANLCVKVVTVPNATELAEWENHMANMPPAGDEPIRTIFVVKCE